MCLLPMEISWITHSMMWRCLLATSVVVWQKCCPCLMVPIVSICVLAAIARVARQ